MSEEKRKPLSCWEKFDEAMPPALVWHAQLNSSEKKKDKRYIVEVLRTSESEAIFSIFDHEAGDVELMSEKVGLYFGARFGPDISDVGKWQDVAVRFVDDPKRKKKTKKRKKQK